MSKLQRLRDNVAVVEFLLTQDGRNSNITDKYTGFGGLGFVLNPLDKAAWAKSDLCCYDDTVRLYKILRDYSRSDMEYNNLVQSMKASVLTAFYTPEIFVKAIADTIYGQEYVTLKSGVHAGKYKENWISPKVILDPAAGNGVFMKCLMGAAFGKFVFPKTIAFEKDLLTGMLLKRQFGDKNTFVYVDGFEHFPKDELGMYDLVATNVPFGDIKVFDPAYSNSSSKVRREAARYIHRYYVLKGLDCLRNGGIEAYIITSNYLNRDSEQLTEALKSSRLIGAYRLANNLFKDAGTEVGTDLLVLQKEEGRQSITPEESMLLTTYEANGCPTNMYFTCYPDHVIATEKTVDTDAYGKPGFVYYHWDGVTGIAQDLKKVLEADLKANLKEDPGESRQSRQSRSSRDSRDSREASGKEKALKSIHEGYTALYDYEATWLEEDVEGRKKLNELYDGFVQEYGALNKSDNAKTIKSMKLAELLALELRDERGRWEKADILLHPVAFATDDLHEAETPQEALAQSLNDYGKPDMSYMMAMTGMDETSILDALNGEVFWNPLNSEYEIKARFISGNVIEKLEQIGKLWPDVAEMLDKTEESGIVSSVRDSDKQKVYMSMAALKAAIPTPIPFEELDFNLGERWINPQVYAAFATEFFDVPGERPAWQDEDFEVTVKYNPLLDQFAAAANYGYNEKICTQYCVRSETGQTYDGMDLFVHALQNTCPKVMKYRLTSDGCYIYNDRHEREKEEDPEKTQLANTKIEEIRQGFQDWLLRRPKDFRDELTCIYNRRFNCFVKPKYDGSHQTFPGIDMKGLKEKYGIASIYGSQKDCVWMLVMNGGGICDHEVGSGKTLIMCMAAHEMKRLGLVHKPMIIGLKANVSAIAETYRTAYPNARILFARESDYSAANRVAFFNNMKNNDYDCVIMSHEQFGRIPQSKDVELEIMRDEVKQLEDSMNAMEGWGWSLKSRIRKGLERRKRNMEAKILELQNDLRKNKDKVTDFNLLGVDHILVDESHQFKNLGFSTRHDRVAGLGNSEGSKRAFNLLMAIRTIQKKTGRDLGATFLSGTTVTNSLTELYSLFRYLRPKALAKQNITCFDAWAAIFTKKSQEFEFSITNQIVLKERFRYFIKVPELAMFYNEITDFRTAEDVGIERPEKHAMLLNIKPTPDQEEFIGTLMKFAKTGDFSLIGVDCPTDQQRMAKMLYATDLARKMSLDMRMIDPSYGDHPRSKASRCAELVKRYYDKYDDVKGTQLVFSDLSTWQNNSEWSVYGEIKKKLVEQYGIPESEIRFIQECKCDSKKQKLIEEVNKGRVRVLFGSTSMLGTGVNAQQRVVAIHHLDTPWRPSDLEQRDGRGIRKGNETAKLYAGNKVDVIIYAVERSLDSYKFNLLHCKQTFINQLKRGQLAKRTLDEGSMEEKGMNFSEYMAILSGNTDLLERAKLEKKIAGLEAERKNFLRDQRDQKEKQASLKAENEKVGLRIKGATEDVSVFNKARRLTEDGKIVNDLAIDGFTMPTVNADGNPMTAEDKAKALGERLLQIAKTARTSGIHLRIGSIYGFDVEVETLEVDSMLGEIQYENVFYVKSKSIDYRYTHNAGHLNRNSPRISSENPLQALLGIPSLLSKWQAKVDENNSRIKQLESIMGQTWNKEDELRKLKADLAILDRKINEELKKDGQQEEPMGKAA